MAIDEVVFQEIQRRIDAAALGHKTKDTWFFNGGTIVAISLTTASSLFAGNVVADGKAWIGAVLAGLATGVLAIERALSFGSRWRFHKEMLNAYQSLADKLAFARLSTDEAERRTRIAEIEAGLSTLRAREAAIPGAGLE